MVPHNEAMNINQESLNTAGQENQMSVTSNNTVVNFDDEGYINGALRDICVIAVDHNNNLVMVDSEVPCWWAFFFYKLCVADHDKYCSTIAVGERHRHYLWNTWLPDSSWE